MPTVLITGANRGIGLEFVNQYADDKCHVIAACRQSDSADTLQDLAKLNPSIQIETLDVTDQASIDALAGKLNGQAIDVLINCAGIYSGGSSTGVEHGDDTQTFGKIDPEAWDKVLRTNTIAPIMVTQAFTPHVLLGEEKKIVMLSSMMGSISRETTDSIAYRTSKAALNMAMRNVAQALREHHITVISFHPGWVRTDMGGSQADISTDESVTGMRKIIAGLTLEQSGSFLGYDGAVWPW